MDQIILKPCPFCGGNGLHSEEAGDFVAVMCDSCGAVGPYVRTANAKEADESWNRRV